MQNKIKMLGCFLLIVAMMVSAFAIEGNTKPKKSVTKSKAKTEQTKDSTTLNINETKQLTDSIIFQDVWPEESPKIDMARLMSLLVYPDEARRAGIEGNVYLNILVQKTGKVTKYIVAMSDNKMLNAAAIQAMKDYGNVIPAKLNGKNIACWETVPFQFKMKQYN
jgi:TonB family protein